MSVKKVCLVCGRSGNSNIFVKSDVRRGGDVCKTCFPEFVRDDKNRKYRQNYYPQYYQKNKKKIVQKNRNRSKKLVVSEQLSNVKNIPELDFSDDDLNFFTNLFDSKLS